MSMGIPSCLLQLEKTAINSWDGSGRISMQQFRLCMPLSAVYPLPLVRYVRSSFLS